MWSLNRSPRIWGLNSARSRSLRSVSGSTAVLLGYEPNWFPSRGTTPYHHDRPVALRFAGNDDLQAPMVGLGLGVRAVQRSAYRRAAASCVRFGSRLSYAVRHSSEGPAVADVGDRYDVTRANAGRQRPLVDRIEGAGRFGGSGTAAIPFVKLAMRDGQAPEHHIERSAVQDEARRACGIAASWDRSGKYLGIGDRQRHVGCTRHDLDPVAFLPFDEAKQRVERRVG